MRQQLKKARVAIDEMVADTPIHRWPNILSTIFNELESDLFEDAVICQACRGRRWLPIINEERGVVEIQMCNECCEGGYDDSAVVDEFMKWFYLVDPTKSEVNALLDAAMSALHGAVEMAKKEFGNTAPTVEWVTPHHGGCEGRPCTSIDTHLTCENPKCSYQGGPAEM